MNAAGVKGLVNAAGVKGLVNAAGVKGIVNPAGVKGLVNPAGVKGLITHILIFLRLRRDFFCSSRSLLLSAGLIGGLLLITQEK